MTDRPLPTFEALWTFACLDTPDFLTDRQESAIRALHEGEVNWKKLTSDLIEPAFPPVFEAWRAVIRRSDKVNYDQYARALAQSWTGTHYPMYDLSYAVWLEAFRDVGFRINGRVADRPTEPVTVFRGGESWVGMSWTPIRSVAEWFANENGGQVWECEVQPEAILAIFDNVCKGEVEYVIDPTELADIFES